MRPFAIFRAAGAAPAAHLLGIAPSPCVRLASAPSARPIATPREWEVVPPMSFQSFSVASDGRLEDRGGVATSLRQHGFALLQISDPEAKQTVRHYKTAASAFFDQPVEAKVAATERLNGSGSGAGVTATYLPAGDGAARALMARREFFALGMTDGGGAASPIQEAIDAGAARVTQLASAAGAAAGAEPEPEPEPEGNTDGGFHGAALATGRLCQALAEGLLAELAESMGVSPVLFRPKPPRSAGGAMEAAQPARHSLTAFHYLGGGSQQDDADDASVMLATHYDMNMLTIQIPSESPGLEVLDIAVATDPTTTSPPVTEAAVAAHCGWISVESLMLPAGESFDLIVFAGAPLHRLTAGYFPACSHRVVAAPGKTTRVSSVYKQKVADDATLSTQVVIEAARLAGTVDMSTWTAQAAAVLRPSVRADHPFLALEPSETVRIDDMELRQLEVAAALHNLAEMRPELAGGSGQGTPETVAVDVAPAGFIRAEVEGVTWEEMERLRTVVILERAKGENLGASMAKDATILGYANADSASARAGLPIGCQIVAVDGNEVSCLDKVKQRLGACVPGASVAVTCAPTRAAAITYFLKHGRNLTAAQMATAVAASQASSGVDGVERMQQ